MKIALDVMGGDHAPGELIAGAYAALKSDLVDASEVVLVGDEKRVADEIINLGEEPVFETIDAPEVIGMDEHPAKALRRKPRSSIVVSAGMLREESVDAMVSAGNTGAAVAAATLLVGLLNGVRRPGIAVAFHSAGGPCTLIDCGANIHCQPEDLYAYGEMASEYMTGVHGVERPRIGLLNIGEEDAKGSPLVKKTRDLFGDSPLNFIGNVEGQDVFTGRCDVIVCEGFVGNVVLKVSEGLGQYIANLFHAEVKAHRDEQDGEIWTKVAHAVLSRTDYAEYGGAPLLGVKGSVIICHGRSDRRAIANALRVSKRFITAKVNQNIEAGLADNPAISGDAPTLSEPDERGEER